MARKKYTPEKIISLLREAEIQINQGQTVFLPLGKLGLLSRPITVGVRNMGD